MDDIRASIGCVQMRKLQADLEKRIRVRNKYVKELANIKGVIVPFADNTEFVSNYIMPIVLVDSTKEKRDRVRDVIHQAGIQTSNHYPAIHKFSIYQDCGAMLPKTEYVADNEITLPMYATLTDQQIEFIVKTVNRAIND